MISLSWKLAMVLKGQARPELLDTYESDRLPVIRQLVCMTERATKLFNSTTPLVHAALTRLAPESLSPSAVQYRAARQAGPAVGRLPTLPNCQGRRANRVAARGRASARRACGRGATLRNAGPGPTLTLFVSPDAGRIADAFRPWENVLALRPVPIPGELADGPGWLLVRPDGYLAGTRWRTQRRAAARRLAGSLAHSTSSLSAARASESRRRSSSSINAHSPR